MNKKTIVSLVCFSLLSGTCLADQPVKPKGASVNPDIKTRVIDSQELMAKTEKGKKTADELQETYKKLAEDVQNQNKELKKAVRDLEQKKGMLSKEAFEKEQEAILAKRDRLGTMSREYEEKYRRAAQRATEDMVEDIVKVVEEIAKAEGLDEVRDKSGRVLYASNKADYTEKVLKRMDEKYSSDKKTA